MTATNLFPIALRGQRVLLRELEETDFDSFVEIFSKPDVIRFLPMGPATRENEEEWLQAQMAAARTPSRLQYTLTVAWRGPDEVIGTARIGIDRPEHSSGDLGYALDPNRWGQGLATEAATLLVRFGFEQLGLHRIWATHEPNNQRSGRVLERVGMRRGGVMRDHMFAKGAWRDSVLYSVLERDWPTP